MSAPIRAELPVRGSYRIEAAHSSATFRARGLFGLPVRGSMPIRSGALRIADGRARVTAELDAAALDTGNRRRDKDVRSPQLLDVARFPAVCFEGEVDGDLECVRGTLTVHGETVPTELAVQEMRRDDSGVEVVATVRLDRHAFGVSALRAIIYRYVDVELTVSLVPAD